MITYTENIFFFALLLTQLLPFFIKYPLFNTNVLAKVIFITLFCYNLLLKNNTSLTYKKYRPIISLFALYFISQSISFVHALSIEDFLMKYQNFLVSSIVFFLLFLYINDKKSIEKTLYIILLAFIFNSIIQFLIHIYPIFFIQLGKFFIHPAGISLIMYKMNQGQIYVESYDELLIPIILYFLTKYMIFIKRIFFILSLFIIILFSFISNIRTKFLMFLYTLFFGGFLFLRKNKKYLFLLVFSIFVFIFFIYKLQLFTFSFTIIDRFLLEDNYDYFTVLSRFDRWKKALEIGFSSPLLGVGLGNYYNYLNWREQGIYSDLPFSVKNEIHQVMSKGPLNIFFTTFAETGLLGLISLLLLILYFLNKDIKILQRYQQFPKYLVVSFWALFIFSLFNPVYSMKFQVLWWLIRVLIEKLSSKSKIYA